MPVADCGDYEEIPPRFPIGRLWVFEVGERSEVGALESPLVAVCWDYEEIPLSQGCPWQTVGIRGGRA